MNSLQQNHENIQLNVIIKLHVAYDVEAEDIGILKIRRQIE